MAEKTKSKKITDDELLALVTHELALADDARQVSLDKMTKALEYFQGNVKKYIPNEKGRSGAVSLDLADTMGWMLPGIIRVFTASEHMALVEPVGKDDVEWAQNATEGVNYDFWKENDGYRIIHTATWDSLLAGNGIVKVWYDEKPEKSVSFHSGLDEVGLAELVGPDNVEVLESSERRETIITPDGMQVEVPVYDVKIERAKDYGCIKIDAIAPEDYGKDDDSKTCDEARFQYHRAKKTRSDLIEMGFKRSEVEKIGRSRQWETPQDTARNMYLNEQDGDPSTEIVDFYEIFVRVDINGDGIAEFVKVDYAGHKSGGTILHWQEWEDEQPFQDIPCDPMPHRWEARSIADETMDVQEVKTVLIRQGLDNIYATSNPQRFVRGSIKNPEALFSPNFGEVIFGEPDSMIEPMPIPFVAEKVFDGIAYQDQVIERRTGVSRTTMALDPEALQNQTATANQNARDAAYSQIELIARNQAELGWKKVFKKILQLEIKHRDIPREIRMKGKPVTVDPRHWNSEMDVSINVGLGTGSRDRDMAILAQVKQDLLTLAQAAQVGGYPEVAVHCVPYLLTTMHKFGEASGIKNPELFYPEMDEEVVMQAAQFVAEQKGKPDPKLEAEQMKLQSDAQAKQQDMQLEQVKMQFEFQMEQMRHQAAIDKEAAQMQADMQVKMMEAAFEEKKLAVEDQFKRDELTQKRELALLELALKRGEAEAGIGSSETENSMLAAMKELTAALAHSSAAPKRIVRDPVTGKALGLETMPPVKPSKEKVN
jgi:hypothetical protein